MFKLLFVGDNKVLIEVGECFHRWHKRPITMRVSHTHQYIRSFGYLKSNTEYYTKLPHVSTKEVTTTNLYNLKLCHSCTVDGSSAQCNVRALHCPIQLVP